ncbi:hypothetical protein ACLOJK_019205, partial [Asimina triloba]
YTRLHAPPEHRFGAPSPTSRMAAMAAGEFPTSSRSVDLLPPKDRQHCHDLKSAGPT